MNPVKWLIHLIHEDGTVTEHAVEPGMSLELPASAAHMEIPVSASGQPVIVPDEEPEPVTEPEPTPEPATAATEPAEALAAPTEATTPAEPPAAPAAPAAPGAS